MIPCIDIIRLEESIEGTFGVLVIQKQLFCTTLEPYNKKQIATGMYRAVRFHSPKFKKDTFKLRYVLGKTNVEFHPGNWVKDTDACILLGQYPAKLRGQRAIANSGATFDRFMDTLVGHNTIIVTVKEAF